CVFGVSFFFQAEDGIRDFHVTGVQTCALPIWERWSCGSPATRDATGTLEGGERTGKSPLRGTNGAWCWRRCLPLTRTRSVGRPRSEERRVGKEWRWAWWAEQWLRQESTWMLEQ